MPHPLDGAWLKLDRTHTQFVALHDEIQAFLQQHPYTATFDADIETGEHVARAHLDAVPPPMWSVQVGEIIHNLRSSLDHVVYELSIRDTGRAVAGSEFPIFVDEARYRAQARRKIRGIGAEGRALIERLQPFKALERNEVPERHALWVLQELSNIDKHRTLHMCSIVSKASNVTIESEGGVEIASSRVTAGPLESGAEIARWKVSDPYSQGKVVVNAQLTRDIALDHESGVITQGRPVSFIVQRLAGYVRARLVEFMPLFE